MPKESRRNAKPGRSLGSTLFIVAVLAIAVYLVAQQSGMTKSGTTSGNSILPALAQQDANGSISVFFCPQDNCGFELNNAIRKAGKSVDCALYELNLPYVISTLEEKQKSIPVRIMIDSDNIGEEQSLAQFKQQGFLKTDDRGPFMHDKFCVIDGKTVTTGSMNATGNDDAKNNNNLEIIESPALAANYSAEFDEIWNGEFGKSSPKNATTAFRIAGTGVDNFFCPEDDCEEHILAELDKAQKSVDFMTFSFTSDAIEAKLIELMKKGVVVRGVFEKRSNDESYSAYFPLQKAGADVKLDGNPATMHHKVFIIDGKAVTTGSMNPTANGNEKNDENLIILHGQSIAERFEREFEKVFAEGSAE
ncbi:MAG: hypothetical protein HY394_04270 [Candidatus Diapherotrites archaeon]|nr:hypothetical protein [Candidatus Diapherotrites archaeon]